MRLGARVKRRRIRVTRFQYLLLALVILVGTALLVSYVHGYLLTLPDPIPN